MHVSNKGRGGARAAGGGGGSSRERVTDPGKDHDSALAAGKAALRAKSVAMMAGADMMMNRQLPSQQQEVGATRRLPAGGGERKKTGAPLESYLAAHEVTKEMYVRRDDALMTRRIDLLLLMNDACGCWWLLLGIISFSSPRPPCMASSCRRWLSSFPERRWRRPRRRCACCFLRRVSAPAIGTAAALRRAAASCCKAPRLLPRPCCPRSRHRSRPRFQPRQPLGQQRHLLPEDFLHVAHVLLQLLHALVPLP